MCTSFGEEFKWLKIKLACTWSIFMILLTYSCNFTTQDITICMIKSCVVCYYFVNQKCSICFCTLAYKALANKNAIGRVAFWLTPV